MKLNLGCGNDYKEGYINIDKDKRFCLNGCDLECDIRCLPYEDESVDEIIAEGIIEHISYREVIFMVNSWYKMLKPNGFLIIETPNKDRVLLDQLKEGRMYGSHSFETIWGGQQNPTEYHVALYSKDTIAFVLHLAGFCGEISFLKPVKNLESGEDWNIRVKAKKKMEWHK